jgi:hypothetical protein
MIQFITLNEQRYTFLDFLELTEGISPRAIEYIFSKDSTSSYGAFDIAGEKVLCILTKTQRPGWFEVGFGKHIEGRPTDPEPENYSMTEQIPTQKFFDLFGKVLFVIMDMSNKRVEGVSRLRFSGGYKAIGDFYKVLMLNKLFMSKLASLGFQLDVDMMEKYGSGIFILKRI